MRQLFETNPRAQFARDQQELSAMALNESLFEDEEITHLPLCVRGFVEWNGERFIPMSEENFRQAAMNIFRLRPSARKIKVSPNDGDYKEVKVVSQSPEFFARSWAERAEYLAREYLRRPGLVGFALELHDVGETSKRPSASLSLFEREEVSDDIETPLTIKVLWRTNF